MISLCFLIANFAVLFGSRGRERAGVCVVVSRKDLLNLEMKVVAFGQNCSDFLVSGRVYAKLIVAVPSIWCPFVGALGESLSMTHSEIMVRPREKLKNASARELSISSNPS
jgi:hypothetical protein